jgi:hypothetical protein
MIAVGDTHRAHLVIADIVVTLIHTLPVWSDGERFCDVLDIRDFFDEGTNRPANCTPCNSFQIN